MSQEGNATLAILGCGNLGSAILKSLLSDSPSDTEKPLFSNFVVTVRSAKSKQRLEERFSSQSSKLKITEGGSVDAARAAQTVILAVDPSDVEKFLKQDGLVDALSEKLLISVAAGWTRPKLESTLYGSETSADNTSGRAWVARTLPNVAASVAQSLTAIEVSEPTLPDEHLKMTESIFNKIGKTVQIAPRLMDAITALGGSTPAFFAVICDALIDAAVAVGVPRDLAHTVTFQSMLGSAALMQSGIHPALLRDQGTSPEGCTIGGLMVMEEAGVRGHIGKALREAVTIARLMESKPHLNDTRH